MYFFLGFCLLVYFCYIYQVGRVQFGYIYYILFCIDVGFRFQDNQQVQFVSQLNKIFYIMIFRKLVLFWLGFMKVLGYVFVKIYRVFFWKQFNSLDVLQEFRNCVYNCKFIGRIDFFFWQFFGKEVSFGVFIGVI